MATHEQQAILNKISPVIAELLGVELMAVTMEADFSNDLGADSLDRVELMMKFEREFKISFPEKEWDLITTVGDVVRLIEQAQNQTGLMPTNKTIQQSEIKSQKGTPTHNTKTPETFGLSENILHMTVEQVLNMPIMQTPIIERLHDIPGTPLYEPVSKILVYILKKHAPTQKKRG